MNTVLYTICTIEYLSFAESLGQSIKEHSPETKFYIFLLTKSDVVSFYNKFISFDIIDSYHQPEVFGLKEFAQEYSNFELCCALKPTLAKYLLNKLPLCKEIIYFDSDIILYNKVQLLIDELGDKSILFCPHFINPPKDTLLPTENSLLNAGIYNAGFFMVKNNNYAILFLDWWESNLHQNCKVDFCNGLFVDQLWLNLAPIYFSEIKICFHLGVNVAYWNLHERFISQINNEFTINSMYPLVFFHYSGFNIKFPTQISRFQNRFNFESRQDIIPLYQTYVQKNIENRYEYFVDFKGLNLDLPQDIKYKNKTYKYSVLAYIKRLFV